MTENQAPVARADDTSLPLDAAARAVHGALNPESDALDVWDGVYQNEAPFPEDRREAYLVAEAAIRAAATKGVLARVLGEHEVSEDEFGMDGAPQVLCSCGEWSWDSSLKPSWESWESEYREHVAEAQIAALTARKEG